MSAGLLAEEDGLRGFVFREIERFALLALCGNAGLDGRPRHQRVKPALEMREILQLLAKPLIALHPPD